MRGQQRHDLDRRLRNENTVERIGVDRRQPVDCNRVLAGNGQLRIAVLEKSAAKKPWIHPKIIAPKPRLMTTSQMLAALKSSSLRDASINARASDDRRSASPTAQSSKCVSSRNSPVAAYENPLDFVAAHFVEIVRHRNLSGHEADPPDV
jgi:hypothetical protein